MTVRPTIPPATALGRAAMACVKSPVALTSSTASPRNGNMPRITSGLTNAEAPQAPNKIGKRNPA